MGKERFNTEFLQLLYFLSLNCREGWYNRVYFYIIKILKYMCANSVVWPKISIYWLCQLFLKSIGVLPPWKVFLYALYNFFMYSYFWFVLVTNPRHWPIYSHSQKNQGMYAWGEANNDLIRNYVFYFFFLSVLLLMGICILSKRLYKLVHFLKAVFPRLC